MLKSENYFLLLTERVKTVEMYHRMVYQSWACIEYLFSLTQTAPMSWDIHPVYILMMLRV